jgi:ribosomal peptide maturation radical SAM protein 1
VLPKLAERPERLTLFWETKANLKRPQVKLLADAGVYWIQPGIESLDSRVLKLINKGVQASQNIQLLRWCREDGIRVAWNMLWGFPGEEDSWYADTAELITLLHHLQPPRLLLRLRYDRYSVYHSRAEDYGLKLRPLDYMPLAFPLKAGELSDLAYYFEAVDANGKRPEPLSSRPGVIALNDAVLQWKRRFWRGLPPVLSMTDDGYEIRIIDTRECALSHTVSLLKEDREVYLACANMPLRSKIGADAIVDDLKRRRLLAEIDGRLIALATEGEIPSLPPASAFPGGWVRSERRAREFRPAQNGQSSA